jgi:DNA-binding FadR family transcriptional regulator
LARIGLRPAAEGGSDATATVTPMPVAAAVGSAGIAARLRQAILDGAYGFGERLPAERDLAEHFSASRGTIREALRRLEDAGLVTRRVGSGTFVAYRATAAEEDIAERTSPLELVEVRLAIEPHLARLAAAHATARDLDRMGQALRRIEAAGDDREAFSRADEQFHLAFAECSRNPLMVAIYKMMNEVRGHAQWDEMKDKILSPQRIAEYNVEHRRLYDALRSRDPTTAVAIITEHLDHARRDLQGVVRDGG